VPNSDRFQNPWGLIASSLGFAVGIGHFLFFPRLALRYGGGAFLIPWMVCMAVWSLPLIAAEYTLGKRHRRSVLWTAIAVLGDRYAWVGAFLGVVCLAVLFTHSVAVGWVLKYLIFSFTDAFDNIDLELSRSLFESHSRSFTPMISHLVTVTIGASVVYLGVNGGIQRVNLVLVPAVFLLAFVGAMYAAFLPGTGVGISKFFFLSTDGLGEIRVWRDALAYSAVSYAGGLGIYLTYSTYGKFRRLTFLEGAAVAFGAQAFSLLSAVAAISLVYGSLPSGEAESLLGSGMKDMEFGLVVMPKLFSEMADGKWIAVGFFAGLFLVSLTTLIGLIELPVRVGMDLGFQRHQSVLLVWLFAALFGMPGAIYHPFLDNQRFVWGNGLILAGIFLSLMFRRHLLTLLPKPAPGEGKGKFGTDFWVKWLFRALIPLLGILLIAGLLDRGMTDRPDDWWNPFALDTPATWLVQCGLVLTALIFLNGRIRSLVEKSGL
jgi:NSS family neurotransmitter:Na+ symporter